MADLSKLNRFELEEELKRRDKINEREQFYNRIYNYDQLKFFPKDEDRELICIIAHMAFNELGKQKIEEWLK